MRLHEIILARESPAKVDRGYLYLGIYGGWMLGRCLGPRGCDLIIFSLMILVLPMSIAQKRSWAVSQRLGGWENHGTFATWTP